MVKLSTYINALAKAGFVIEQLVEECDETARNASGDVEDCRLWCGLLYASHGRRMDDRKDNTVKSADVKQAKELLDKAGVKVDEADVN